MKKLGRLFAFRARHRRQSLPRRFVRITGAGLSVSFTGEQP